MGTVIYPATGAGVAITAGAGLRRWRWRCATGWGRRPERGRQWRGVHMAWLLRTADVSATYSTSGADAPITAEAGEMYSASDADALFRHWAIIGAGAAITEELVRRTSSAHQTAREQLAPLPSQELRTRRLGKVEHHRKWQWQKARNPRLSSV